MLLTNCDALSQSYVLLPHSLMTTLLLNVPRGRPVTTAGSSVCSRNLDNVEISWTVTLRSYKTTY